MPATKYTYSIAIDTLNGSVRPQLAEEIDDSAIATALNYVTEDGDVLDIWFADALSGPDQTTLTGIVNAHDGDATDTDNVSAGDLVSTTSTTFETCPNMVLTLSPGEYFITFSVATYGSNNGTKSEFALFVGGAQEPNSVRRGEGSTETAVSNTLKKTIVHGDTVELCWRKLSGGTVNVVERNFSAIRI